MDDSMLLAGGVSLVIGVILYKSGKGGDKNWIVKTVGLILVIVGAAVLISATMGFPSFWAFLAWLFDKAGAGLHILGDGAYFLRDIIGRI